MSGRYTQVSLDQAMVTTIRQIVPGVTDPTAIKEIIKRYLYLHNEVDSLQDAEHLMKFWRGQGQGKKGSGDE